MLRAIVVSFLVHFSIVYLIPSVQILPPNFEYIEVEDVWMETREETGQDEIGDEGLYGEDGIQERPQLNPVPTDLEAVEPDMVEERSPDAAEWDMPFIGIDPNPPNNLKIPTRVNQFNSHATQPASTIRETLAPDEIMKQAPESEVIETESDIPPQDDVSLTAEQRYEDVIRSQTIQTPDEEISPGFTKLQTPEIVESKSQELVSFRKIERISPKTAFPFMSRGETSPDKWEKLDMPSVLLPDRQEISEQTEDEIVVAVDNMMYIASQDISRKTEDKMEELPRAAIPEKSPMLLRSRPFEQREQIAASPTRTLLPSQEIPLSPIVFPHTTESKRTLVKDAFAAEKVEVESEEVVVEAVVQPLSQAHLKQETLPRSFADEPRGVSIPQDIQDGRRPFEQVQEKPLLISQTQRIETKRSFVIGGKIQENMAASTLPRIGIVVKQETLSQIQEPDVTLQEDDALERIATEEADSPSFAIEGPASKREVLYKPTWLPEVNIDVEVDIRLKFWVLPDGSVGEVIPLQRGDVRLERAAIEYLKNWRFTPVSQDRPQVWGIIPIKYKFQ